MNSLRVVRMGRWQGDGRPFWCSLLAVLALHGVLAWGLASHQLAPIASTTQQPMQVRLAAEAQSGGPVVMRQAPAAPRSERAQPKAVPADVPHQAIVPAPQQVSPPTPAATAQPRPAAGNEPAQHLPAPASNLLQLNPTQANAPVAANTHAVAPVAAANTAPTSQAGSAAPRADADAQPAAKGPVDMPSASIRYQVQPVLTYPPGSEELGESGSVMLRVLVDEKGVPIKVERLKSSGYPRLDQHAVSVIRRARFVPHLVQGEPRAFWATVPLNFVLN
jgi:protein TonB